MNNETEAIPENRGWEEICADKFVRLENRIDAIRRVCGVARHDTSPIYHVAVLEYIFAELGVALGDLRELRKEG